LEQTDSPRLRQGAPSDLLGTHPRLGLPMDVVRREESEAGAFALDKMASGSDDRAAGRTFDGRLGLLHLCVLQFFFATGVLPPARVASARRALRNLACERGCLSRRQRGTPHRTTHLAGPFDAWYRRLRGGVLLPGLFASAFAGNRHCRLASAQ